ncbi:MAG: hydroxymethylbilane synthase [Phycisphaeraceae bacterium]|nr:hydroxymethylbilane synthase [Phycisphaeraceae bacterium]
MRRSKRPIVIASRQSRLAQAQARLVGEALGRLHPKLEITYHWMTSEGDQQPDVSLADRGGKGLFAGAIEQELIDGRADLAVHSLKDLPVQETAGLTLAAIPGRGDVRDALISPHDGQLADLPEGATVGTASPRRAAQLKRLRPDLTTDILRGSVETRLVKVLEKKQFDATLLAMAGLMRAGLGGCADRPIDPDVILPAAGQAALAIQCRVDDHVTLSRCLPLNDPVTANAVHAERQIVAALDGDCHSPIGVLVEPSPTEEDQPGYRVRARVLSPDGSEQLEADEHTTPDDLDRTVRGIADDLVDRGARRLILPA